ncbi:coiled-coil domain-containing protein 50 isoform X2 [Thamnophis elegans]|uniref:coiled-coil domain-containing protein 50 isoform X2 n=1 Tax=Thamnophis elegans TaxID=35005 RepID=UPI001376DC9B|nr:coiled-coil domain-containing protein 50 isoform X2 [Thamnophis elegans]
MAEVGIDRSKLPGVKEVCRDFAVREDHTLAHSLQEQEIEHHLATNIQRNRLVKHDLRMAKELQEEEDRRARARLQEKHKDLERQDCEIAQEIQVKLVIEAEEQRRQEEDDEDIARILQQKELKEEKRRKKLPPEPLRLAASEEAPCPENRDRWSGSPRELGPKDPQPRSAGGQPPQTREPWRGPPLVPEGLDLETWESGSGTRKSKDVWRKERRERKKDGPERPPYPKGPPDVVEEEEAPGRPRSRPNRSQEKSRGPLLLVLDAEPPPASRGSRDPKMPRSPERPQRTPPPLMDQEEKWRSGHGSRGPQGPGERGPSPTGRERRVGRRHGQSPSPNPDPGGLPPLEDRGSPRPPAHHAWHQDLDAGYLHCPRRENGEREPRGARASPTSHRRDREGRRPRNPGTKPRGPKEDAYARHQVGASRDPEAYDAEIAWKLQEEELLASQVDRRAAQVAQDEEIARLLMAEEKKAFKKAKGREKKRQDQDWKETPEVPCGRSREGYDPHRGRSEKPTRAAPPLTKELDPPSGLAHQQNVAHQISKSESAHKGHPYKQ